MELKRIYASFIPLVILFLSLACALTGEVSEPPPEIDAEDVIATSVAATVAAQAAEVQPTAEPTQTESVPESDVSFQGVSFDFDDSLAGAVNPENVPGEGDENNPWFSTPDHLRFTFTDWVLADAFHKAEIRIYPVAEFRAVNTNLNDGLDTLQTILDIQPADHDGIGVLDFFNAAQFIRSQVDYKQFQNGRGVRFISQYGQAGGPIGWPDLFYAFQGLTDDGSYYISVILPVNHPSLPHPDQVVLDDAFYDNFMTYRAETQDHLNNQVPDSFQPSLVVLDAVVESLRVEGE